MNDVIDQGYAQAKEVLNKTQEKALGIVVKKEDEVRRIQEEIEKILKEHDLNAFDVDRYKHEKNIDKFLNTEFPG